MDLIGSENCEALLKRKEEALDVIQDSLKNARIKIAISTINKLKIKYGKDLTSIRINNVVWEQFNKFSEEHKEFTKRDLLSMELKEYMNKFK